MKKIVMILMFALVFSGVSIVSAETYSDSLPGGKNYINPDNVETDTNIFNSIESIKVLPNQMYTFTIPDQDLLGDIDYVYLAGETTYISYDMDTILEPGYGCIVDNGVISCTFTTSSLETSVDIIVNASQIGLFYSYYGLENFQLEEGPIFTGYEQYVAPSVDLGEPEFSGSGGFITSYETVTLLDSIISNHIVAIDAVDGDLSEFILVETDEYTGNEQIIGSYDVLLSVTDSSNNKAFFSLTIIVKDEINPYFTGDTIIPVDVEAGMLVDDVISTYISYGDDYNNDVVLEKLSDLYTGNESILGDYAIELRVTDQSGNEVIKQFTIQVTDYLAPNVTSTLMFNKNIDDSVSLSDILDDLVVTDNYDQSPTVVVTTNGYTGNEFTVGTYFVDIAVKDFSNNQKEYTLQINVFDSTSPVISGPSNLSFSYENLLTLPEVLAQYTVSDNSDILSMDNAVIVSDTYSNKTSMVGEYEIIFEIEDVYGNSTQKTVSIVVFDDVVPLIYVDEYIVVLDLGSSFDSTDAMRLLINNHELDRDNYNMDVLVNEYEGNEDIPGLYDYKVQFVNKSGEIVTKDFVIEVTDGEVNEPNYIRAAITTSIIVGFSIFVFVKTKK